VWIELVRAKKSLATFLFQKRKTCIASLREMYYFSGHAAKSSDFPDSLRSPQDLTGSARDVFRVQGKETQGQNKNDPVVLIN
jgi:hypothetical protein